MTTKPQVGDWITDPSILDRLPEHSVVMSPESPYGDHCAYQKTADILDDELYEDEEVHDVWASILYTKEHKSVDVINLAHEDEDGKRKVQILYIAP